MPDAAGGGIAGCSSSSDDNSTPPLAAPSHITLVAYDEAFLVNHTSVGSYGTGENAVAPEYEFRIGVNNGNFEASQKIGSLLRSSTGGGGNARYIIARSNAKANAVEPGMSRVTSDLIQNGNELTFWIRCNFEGVGQSAWVSAKVTPVPPAVNPAADAVRADAFDQLVRLSWSAGSYADKYQAAILAEGSETSKINDTNSKEVKELYALFSGLTNGQTYDVYLRAGNNNGYAEWMKAGTVAPAAAVQTPAKPQNVSVKGGNRMLSITWSASTDAAKYSVSCQKQGAADKVETETAPTADTITVTVPGLENGAAYDCSVYAVNSAGYSEPASVTGTPTQQAAQAIDFRGFESQNIGMATEEYIFSVNVPHSDFARVTRDAQNGGRIGSDRISRVIETAIGNLFADSVHWYVENVMGEDIDFAYLMGGSLDAAIAGGAVTPKDIIGAMSTSTSNGVNDTIILIELPGSAIASDEDYNIDISYDLNGETLTDHYPYDFINSFPKTLLGQTAACLRKAHPGGMAGSGYQCDIWGNPSSSLRYEIEYLPYDYQAFREKFIAGVSKEALAMARTQNRAQSASDEYAAKDGYLLPAKLMSGVGAGNSLMFRAQGYQRGKVRDTVSINGQKIDPGKIYRIATTPAAVDKYSALLDGTIVKETNVLVWNMVANYIYNQGTVTPKTDGRVNVIGGIPFSTALENPVLDTKYQ